MTTFSELVNLTLPFTHPYFISEKWLCGVSKFSQAIPDFPANVLCLETSLSPAQNFFDLSFFLNFSKKSMTSLRQLCEETLGEKVENNSWGYLISFFTAKSGKKFLKKSGISHLGLELDFDEKKKFITQPNLFIPMPPNADSKMLTQCIRHFFFMHCLSSNTLSLAENCFKNLSPGFFCRYLGFMLARTNDSIRLQISTMEGNFLGYDRLLTTLGYTSSLEPLRLMYEKFRPFCFSTMLQLDIKDFINNRIGLELHPKKSNLLEWKENMSNILRVLREENLISSFEESLLFQWIGAQKKFVQSKDDYKIHARTINHIKIVVDKGKIIQTKAYLVSRII